jgi:dUTP pyrophosphatase
VIDMDGYNAEYVPEFIFTIIDGLDESFTPTRSDSVSTGWDVRAAEDVVLLPTARTLIPLGIKCFAPPGYWLELRPRSSTFGKKSLHALYGVIDNNYEGQLFFACQWIPNFYEIIYDCMDNNGALTMYLNRQLKIEKGERIGQIIPVKRQEMSIKTVSNSEFKVLCDNRGLQRGAGGFGSTGK